MFHLSNNAAGSSCDLTNLPRKGSKSTTIVIVVLLVLLVGIPTCTCGGCAASIYFGLATLSSSEPYKHALAAAQNNAEVQEILGTPIEAGYLVYGSLNLREDGGDCDIDFPISGPRYRGTVRIRGTRNRGIWEYEEVSVRINEKLLDVKP